jgi:hypothetical protein
MCELDITVMLTDDSHFGLCSSHLVFLRDVLALTTSSLVTVLKSGDKYRWRHVSQACPAIEALVRRYGLSLDSAGSCT